MLSVGPPFRNLKNYANMEKERIVVFNAWMDAFTDVSRNFAKIVGPPFRNLKNYADMEKEGVVVFNAYKDAFTDVSKNFAKIVDLSRRNVFTRKSRAIAKTVGLYHYQNESTKIANTTYHETIAKSAVG